MASGKHGRMCELHFSLVSQMFGSEAEDVCRKSRDVIGEYIRRHDKEKINKKTKRPSRN